MPSPPPPLMRAVADTSLPVSLAIICSTGPPGQHLCHREGDEHDPEQRRKDQQEAFKEICGHRIVSMSPSFLGRAWQLFRRRTTMSTALRGHIWA